MRAVMVMYDSLNRNYLGPYGGCAGDTPNFMRLAERCARFDNHYANSLPCMPARRELHTGCYNFLHRSWGPIEPFDVSVPEMLSRNGIHAHLISDHKHYWEDGGASYHTRYSSWEISRGQEGDNWIVELGSKPDARTLFGNEENPYSPTRATLSADQTNRRHIDRKEEMPMVKSFTMGLDFIEQNWREDNWFLQIETFDPHEPFYLSPDLDEDGKAYDWPPYSPVREADDVVELVRKRYRKLLRLCDEQLGRVLDAFDRYDLWKDTLLLVNTDHGFLLGEHNWWGKSVMPLYNELVNTPFFLYDPRIPGKGVKTALTGNVDIAPTLLDFFGMQIPDSMCGRPLRSVLEKNEKIHDYLLFGIHGGFVNVTDGRYVYMHPPVSADNAPLYEYTLMPTHMTGFFSAQELQTAELVWDSGISEHMPVLKIRREAKTICAHRFGRKLFDNKTDRSQAREVADPETQRYMLALLLRGLEENHCPPEQYLRLGLPSGKNSLDKFDVLRINEEYKRRTEQEYGTCAYSPEAEAMQQIAMMMFPYAEDGIKSLLSDEKSVGAAQVERAVLASVRPTDRPAALYYMRLYGRTS